MDRVLPGGGAVYAAAGGRSDGRGADDSGAHGDGAVTWLGRRLRRLLEPRPVGKPRKVVEDEVACAQMALFG